MRPKHHTKNWRQNDETDAVVKEWNVHAPYEGFMDLWFVFVTALELFILWLSGWLAKQCVRWHSQCSQVWVFKHFRGHCWMIARTNIRKYSYCKHCTAILRLAAEGLKYWITAISDLFFADWIFIFFCLVRYLPWVCKTGMFTVKYNPWQDVFSFLHCSSPEVTFVEGHSWIAGSHWVYWRRDIYSILCMHKSNNVQEHSEHGWLSNKTSHFNSVVHLVLVLVIFRNILLEPQDLKTQCIFIHFTSYSYVWQHFLDTTACKDHGFWSLTSTVTTHQGTPCHRWWDRQRLGGSGFWTFSWRFCWSSNLSENCFAAFPFFSSGDQFRLRWSRWFLQCENRIHLWHRSTRSSVIPSEMDLSQCV